MLKVGFPNNFVWIMPTYSPMRPREINCIEPRPIIIKERLAKPGTDNLPRICSAVKMMEKVAVKDSAAAPIIEANLSGRVE